MSAFAGHSCGEEVAQQVLQCVRAAFEYERVIGAYDGARFGVLLQNLSQRGTEDVADRLRAAVEKQQIQWGSTGIVATISVGVVYGTFAEMTASKSENEADAVLSLALDALERAEDRGGNQVVETARTAGMWTAPQFW